jgi:PAS domain S-box-containing protein
MRLLKHRNDRLVSLIELLALLIASTIALVLPLGYSIFEYSNLGNNVNDLALVKAESLDPLISGNPKLWSYQLQRIEEVLTHYSLSIGDFETSVYDAQDKPVLRIGAPPAWPVLDHSHSLFESGRVVGRVTIAISLRPFLYGVAVAALLGLLLGGTVYAVLRIWPLRLLQRSNAELETQDIALRASEERYRTVAEYTYDWEYWLSPDGCLPYVSPSCLRVTGFQAAEFQQDPGLLSRITHPEDREMIQRHLDAVENPQNNLDLAHMDFRIVTRTGEERWVAHVCQPIWNADHKYLGRRACNRDITERKRAEELLRENERHYRTILEAAIDGFWLVDAQGRLLEVNQAYCRMSGYTEQELRAMCIPDLEAAQPREMTAAAHVRRTQARGEDRFESRHRRKNGSVFDVEISVQYRPANGGQYVAFLRDISARKQEQEARVVLEAELNESQKMEAIGTLAGGIAHDFNNALAIILGNVELARQDVSANPRVLESLAEIRKAGTRSRDLVQQILFFSRRQPTEREPTALVPIIYDVAHMLEATLPARLNLKVYCDAEVPLVIANISQIQQVVINLATNAMQAMRSGPGSIDIRIDQVMLDAGLAETQPELRAMHARHPGAVVRVAVSDTGEGMDAATLGRIFDPFFTTKPVGEGTGLGLSVVRGIVETHEGAITVDSQPGDGTTFTLYLPAAQAEQPGANEPAALTAAGSATLNAEGGKNILYVDDDDSLVFLVRRLLERRGYRVSSYTDQGEALAALRVDPAAFDLVITDYNMPGMSGLDVAREVRALRADLPVAVASGFVDDELRSQAAAAGVRELIYKANAVDEFCEIVQRLAKTVGTKSKTS